jgi:hypothetical protein
MDYSTSPGIYWIVYLPEFRSKLMVAAPLGSPIFLLMNLSFLLPRAGMGAGLEKVWPQGVLTS